ncbi:YbhB/YbcL family Raf kinase inhibitor-like protein [Acidimangrovimonas pyrenivorans]|uniref:YbhB/YbcL family Raf kinase inhibitor-like protein n=1 Tax=Acidimangrovimonas pyrenivorans TaxID=2030798 RepID=A0ABV7AHL6_9RHOB
MAMELTSPAFAPMQPIPREHTCEGANLSPPLNWSGVPEGTVSLLLTCDDPDAPRGVFHHWAACNIPATATGLTAGEGAGQAALNDFRKPGYGGPCPPPGDRPHRYVFRLVALDTRLAPAAGARCPELAALARGHELARAELIGLFGR